MRDQSGTVTTPATDGNYWNNFSSTSNDIAVPVTIVTDLVRASDGNATGASLELVASTFTSVGVGGADNPNADDTNALPQSAARDTFFFNPSSSGTDSATFEFQNLDTNLTYDLSIFGSVPSGPRPLTEITVGAVTQSYDPVDNGETGVGTTTADFAGLVPDTNGTLSFVVTKTGGDANHINSIELTVVPEPASLMLILTGACLTLSSRSRRNRLN